MKQIYLIDYENVGKKGLEGAEALKSGDELYLFHYKGAGEVKYDNLLKLANSGARTQVIKLSTHEKNAMDFQIVALLGYLTGKYGRMATYNIVSKDMGYASAIECILVNVDNELKVRTQETSKGTSLTADRDERIRKELVGNYSPKAINKAIKAFVDSTNLQMFHELLKKELPKDFESIYKCLKPTYKELVIGA